MDEPWYAVRCVIRFPAPSEDQPAVYEERITLWRAESFDDALERAETDAEEYARGLRAEYVGLAQAFHLSVESVGDGTEIFSLMRDSVLSPDDYVAQFFENGDEREGFVE
jgi:hypothetical protein